MRRYQRDRKLKEYQETKITEDKQTYSSCINCITRRKYNDDTLQKIPTKKTQIYHSNWEFERGNWHMEEISNISIINKGTK